MGGLNHVPGLRPCRIWRKELEFEVGSHEQPSYDAALINALQDLNHSDATKCLKSQESSCQISRPKRSNVMSNRKLERIVLVRVRCVKKPNCS